VNWLLIVLWYCSLWSVITFKFFYLLFIDKDWLTSIFLGKSSSVWFSRALKTTKSGFGSLV